MLIHELCTHPFECHACSELLAQCFVSTDPCSQVDLLFILDMSSTVNKIDSRNSDYILGFAKSIVDQLVISLNGTHVGVVLSGNNGLLKIKLNEFTDADLLKAAIYKLEFKDQWTNIYGGLEEAKNAFKPANGARYNVTKVVIFITDGEKANDSYPDPQPSAADLKNSGVEVFVVSHSHYFSKNESTMKLVKSIASEHLVDHLFISDDFGNLKNYVQTFKDIIDKSCATPSATSFAISITTETPAIARTFMNWYSFSIDMLVRVNSVS